MNSFQKKLHAVLSPAEHRLFKKLSTPERIQDYVDALPQNFSYSRGRTLRSPRRIFENPSAYCFEGAVLAAASLAYHGHEPLLLDLRAIEPDVDHVVALFKKGKYWGAISKTNYPVLKWRDPVYASVRELAMSYFHEYFLNNGKKSFKDYSKPFSLQKFDPATWVVSEEPLEWLALELDSSPHMPTVDRRLLTKLRPASGVEVQASDLREWKGKKKIPYHRS